MTRLSKGRMDTFGGSLHLGYAGVMKVRRSILDVLQTCFEIKYRLSGHQMQGWNSIYVELLQKHIVRLSR